MTHSPRPGQKGPLATRNPQPSHPGRLLVRLCTGLLLAILFAWLALAATCTKPQLTTGPWEPAPGAPDFSHHHLGAPLYLDLYAHGGLTPPSNSLFTLHPPESIQIASLAWHPTGINRHGLRWKCRLCAWPIGLGPQSGPLLTYHPQSLTIRLPEFTVAPVSHPLSPQWLALPTSDWPATLALLLTLAFAILPMLTRCLRRPVKLDYPLLMHLRQANHPAAIPLAALLAQRRLVRFAGARLPLASLERHCQTLLP